MKDPVIVDFFVKVALAVIGSLFTLLTGLLIWGIQKLASVLMGNTKALLELGFRVSEVEKHTSRVPKLEGDLNNYYLRLKGLEDKTGGKVNG